MKIFKILGIIALIAIVGFSIAACKDPEPDPAPTPPGPGVDPTPDPPGPIPPDPPDIPGHDHVWGAVIPVTIATCVSGGYSYQICMLDESHINPIHTDVDMNNHEWGDLLPYGGIAAREPTCYVDGWGYRECLANPLHEPQGGTLTRSHNYLPDEYMPTCVINGYKMVYCTWTDCDYEEGPIYDGYGKLGHDKVAWGDVINPPDCVTDGSQKLHCNRILNGKNVFCLIDDADYADYTDITGTPYDTADKIIASLGSHEAGETVTITFPTCLDKGSEQLQCPICDFGLAAATDIDKLVHDWGTRTKTTNSTCITKGWSQIPCLNVFAGVPHYQDTIPDTDAEYDEDSKLQDVPTIPHIGGAYRTTLEPTCTEPGKQERLCQNPEDLGNVIPNTEEPLAALGHKFASWTDDDPATCTEEGSQEQICSRLVDSVSHKIPNTLETIPAKGHTYINYVRDAGSLPTCTDYAQETGTCVNDASHEDTRNDLTAPPVGHIWNWEDPWREAGLRECQRKSPVNCTSKATIGDIGPGGGVIFYANAVPFDYYTGTDNTKVSAYYLEVAPWANTTPYTWASAGASSTNIPDTEKDIGKGMRNTLRILDIDPTAPAASMCRAQTIGGKTDWFLPSELELELIFTNRAKIGDLVIFYYWSSTQGVGTSSQATYMDFSTSTDTTSAISVELKTKNYRIRPIRAF